MIMGYVVLWLLLLALSLWGRRETMAFLNAHPSIGSAEALATYKTLARRNMYLAAAYLPLGIAGVALAVAMALSYGLLGIVVVLVLSVPSLVLSQRSKVYEVRARSLACDPSLESEYARVSETWVKKLLPDF